MALRIVESSVRSSSSVVCSAAYLLETRTDGDGDATAKDAQLEPRQRHVSIRRKIVVFQCTVLALHAVVCVDTNMKHRGSKSVHPLLQTTLTYFTHCIIVTFNLFSTVSKILPV